MKPRKSPTQEHYGPHHSETSQIKESVIDDLNETIIPNGSNEYQSGEMMQYQDNMELTCDKMNVGKTSDLTVLKIDEESRSTMLSVVAVQDNETRYANNEEGRVKSRKIEQIEKEKSSSSSARDEIRESRKRKVKQVTTIDDIDRNRWLCAMNEMGSEIKVKILISNRPYIGDRSTSMNHTAVTSKDLGNDGNQHFCQVCRGFGDVVCCDGCPRVYHYECIPLHSTSRIALDVDDDPWYCP